MSPGAASGAQISQKPRVLIADDHAVLVDGLRKVLEPVFDVAGVAFDGKQLVEAARNIRHDIILTDISMPVLTGTEAIRLIMKEFPDEKFLILTMYPNCSFLDDAMRAGARGYVMKNADASELMAAMNAVLRGETYTPPVSQEAEPIKPVVPSVPSSRSNPMVRRLTPRQREVLQLIADGKQNKEIAELLRISARTVEFHKAEVISKLHVGTTAALIRFALENKLSSK